jgi:hypothetical protein
MDCKETIMPFARALLVLAFLAAMRIPAAASPFLDAATYLNGVWQGDNYVLRVDAARAQASIDPDRPFNWSRFLVKEVTDDEIVFTVGAELFAARLASESIVLTSTSFRGERVMWREGAAEAP